MNAQDPHFWFSIGLLVGLAFQTMAKQILRRFGIRIPECEKSPTKIEVALPRETLNGIGQAVAGSVVDAIHNHIRDLKVPSKN